MRNLDQHDPDVERPNRPNRRTRNTYLKWAAGIAAGLVSIVVLCCVALVSLVNTDGVHKYLLALVQQKASEAAGVPVRLQNFTLHLSSLSVDLYGIRVSGAPPYADQPLLQADHLELGIQIVSVLRGQWYFDSVQIDHPVAWIVVDKHGVSNLPVFKSAGSSHTDIFQLGIRHFDIARGEVYYNSRPSALDAQVQDLAFSSTFNSLLTRYTGKLTYTNGTLSFGSLRPLQHNLEAEFQATPDLFTLQHARVSAGASSATVNATLKNYNSPLVQGQYQIVLDGKQAGQILREPMVPAGIVQLSGSVQYQQSAARSLIQSLLINGDIASSALTLNTPSVHAGVTKLAGHYLLANGSAILRDLRAGILGGEVTAQGTMDALDGNTHASFQVNLQNLSLAQARQTFVHSTAATAVSLKGTAGAKATLTWDKSINNLIAHADLTLSGQASRQQMEQPATAGASPTGLAPSTGTASPKELTVPIQAALHGIYSNANGSLTLANSYLKTSQSTLSLNGTVSRQSTLSIALEANDLSEVGVLADLFRTPGSNSQALDLKGEASFHGTVRGATAAPDLSGQLTAQNLEYNGTRWKTLQTGIELNPSRASLQDLHLAEIGQGQITGSASVELDDWSFSTKNPIQVELTGSSLDMATIERLAGTQIPVTGSLSLSAHLQGSALNPTGTANVTLAHASAFGEPVSEARIDMKGSGSNISATALMQIAAGAIRIQGTVNPNDKTFDAQVNSSGIDLAKLQAMKARGIDAAGVMTIQAQGRGSFDDPAIDADVKIPRLTTSGQVFSQTELRVNTQNRIANIDLSSSVANASLQGKAKVSLSGDYVADASLDTKTLPLQPFLAAYAPGEAENITGQTEIHAQVHGPLKQWKQLEGNVTIPGLKIAYGNSIQIAASPIHADLRNQTVTLQPATIKGTGTDLSIQGAFPIGNSAAASFKAQGTVNLQVAQILDPDLRASGLIKVNVDMTGSHSGPSLGGELDIADANLSTDTSPVGLQHANGVVKITPDRLQISQFSGTLGGGTITAQGAVLYRPSIQFNLGFAANGARMLYPQGVRETANANLKLVGSMTHATLNGSVNLTDLSFTPAFDLSALVNQLSGGVEAPQGRGFAQNLDLNIALNSTSTANLVSRTLSVNGSANLQVRGTAAEPVILGRVNVSGGDVILNGNRFVLTGGTIQFINPSMTEPVLNLALTTTIQQYKIDLRFRGPSNQLRTQYTSDPSLPSADIINLLAFGQTTEASAANSATTSTGQQAEGLVASQVSSQVTSRVSKAAGISQLSISPVIAGGTAAGPPGANLTIQQRVTGNLFVTFSTNVATTQGQTIQGQYQVSPRVAVSATRDPNGGFALDTLIKKSW